MGIRTYICPLRDLYVMDGPDGEVHIPLKDLSETYFMNNPKVSELEEMYDKLIENSNINKEDL